MTAKNVRLRDVAEAAGTSTKTASRVINGDPRVSDATRRRVEEAVTTLGYQVDLMARSLRRGVDDTIGIVVPTIGDPFFAGMLDEIERIAMSRDFKVLVANNSRSPEVERRVIEGLLARRVAGLIVTPNNADYAFLASVRTPVVFLDRHPVGLQAGCVRVDDLGEAKRVVHHLAANGHRRIAFVADDLQIRTSELRYAGYREAMAELGLPLDPDLAAIGFIYAEQAERATTEMLARANPPTAIFSSRSETSLGVARALHQGGRTDVAFVSFGDFIMADCLTPAVTVLDHDPRVLARRAVERLITRLDGGIDHGGDDVEPLTLIARGSGEITAPGVVREVAS
jgi:LacI family transcriptional regulator